MFDYDVSTLKDFTFSSIYDVFALISQNYPVRSRYDIESFEYKSDYLAEGKSYKIVPKSFFEKYQKEYEDEKGKFFKDYYGTQGASAVYSPCDILTIKYNKLLNNRKEIIETKGITSRKYMDKEISNHKFDLIKDVNFTNSYFAYVPTTELAPLPLYRRLKLDPYEMATTIISLIIEASDFPLKLTLEFEKDSVRYKRYVHLFDALNDIQDQLECYMALEGITMTRLAKQIGFPKYAYNNIFSRIIKFNDFKQWLGLKLKLHFHHK